MSGPEDSDLSRLVRDLGRVLRPPTVVALGWPRPDELVGLGPEIDLIAIDEPERVQRIRRQVPGARVREWDPKGDLGPPASADELADAIVVCDGLLESVTDPASFLRWMREVLADAALAIVVTPDRDLVDDEGPGREVRTDARWNASELGELLESHGLELDWIGLARSRSNPLVRSTLLAVVGGTRGDEAKELLATGARNLRFDPEASFSGAEGRERPLRVCIATYEFVGPTKTGGIGTAYTSLAEALSEAGHEVTVLYLGLRDPEEKTPFSHWVDHYARAGIDLVELREEEFPRIFFGHFENKRSYLAYMWLAERDRARPFDVIHFPETLGHGYYSQLAKRQGWAFEDSTIAIGVHSSTYWVMESNRVPYMTGQEFAADFLERESVRLADVVISPSEYMVEWMRKRAWDLPRRLFVQQYVRSRAVIEGGHADIGPSSGAVGEIVFFGRLEPRKGFGLLCDALDILAAEGGAPDVSISFLGKQTYIFGEKSEDYLARRSKQWPWEWRILDDFGQPEAVSYLRGDGTRRLAVMPSLADNTPNTVMEALALGVPFIASRVGGTAELVHSRDLGRCTFDPSGPGGAAALAAAIRRAVQGAAFDPPKPAVDPTLNEEVHLGWHRSVRPAGAGGSAGDGGEASAATPSVSVCLLARSEEHFRETIESLGAQVYPDFEVVMVGEGERLAHGRPRLEAALGSGRWTAVESDDPHRPAALNLSVREARGSHLLFVQEGTVLDPEAISSMADIASRTGAGIVTCASKWAVSGVHGIRTPEGGPPIAGLFYRCFGDTGYLIRHDAFESLGGFATDSDPGVEDHHLLCRAALAGVDIQVIPQPLLDERLRDVTKAGDAILTRSEAVVRTYQHQADGLSELPRIALAQWLLAGSKDVQIRGILGSRSWRVTTPLRWLTEKLGRTRQHVD